MRTQIFVLLSFVLLFAGCASQKMYSGPSRSSGEVALLRAHGVALKSVNGEKVSSGSSGVELLPGEHEVLLTINESNFLSKGPDHQLYKIMMTAEAGREYSITGKRGMGKLCAWPIEPATGRPDFSARPAGCLTRQ